MFTKLTKKFITKYLLPFLNQSGLGRKTKVPLWRIVKAVIYRVKTGVQWRELPTAQFASPILLTWRSVFYHFNKWSKNGSWERLWTNLLKMYKSNLDMSSVSFDGSHTPAKRGGEEVGYQRRKKCKTTNMLFLTDSNGIPIGVSKPVAGNHHDLFDAENGIKKIVSDLARADISSNGLFMNADAGFDSTDFRAVCENLGIIPNFDFNKRNSKDLDNDVYFDELLYKERFAVERTNAWIDAYKALLVRFETTSRNWLSLHYLAFSIILLRKIKVANF